MVGLFGRSEKLASPGMVGLNGELDGEATAVASGLVPFAFVDGVGPV